MMLMHLRQSEFGNNSHPCFIYLSSDASPQGSLEFYITLEDKVSRSSAALLVEATANERAQWVKSGHLRTTCLPVAILGSGKSNAAAKFEALTHSVILDSMSGGDPRNVSAYGNSVVSFCSDFGTEAHISNMPSVSIQKILENNVSQSDGLLSCRGQVCNQRFGPIEQADDSIIADCCILEAQDMIVQDLPAAGVERDSFFGLQSSLMIPGAKHLMDNVQKDVLGALQHFTVFQDARQNQRNVVPLNQLWSMLMVTTVTRYN